MMPIPQDLDASQALAAFFGESSMKPTIVIGRVLLLLEDTAGRVRRSPRPPR
jgi:hypothetical protein